MPKQKGFTLIEILVAIAIIAIGSVVVITSANIAQRSSRDAQRKSDIKKIQVGLQQYYVDHGYYPDFLHLEALSDLNNCTQAPTPCTITTYYLDTIPQEYFYPILQAKGGAFSTTGSPNYGGYDELHYCYEAHPSSTQVARCNTSTPGPGGQIVCNYYRLYARLENGAGPPFAYTCNAGNGQNIDHHDNYMVTPNSF